MATYTHLLIHPDEDGDPITFLTDADLERLLTNPVDEYGVRVFLKMADLDVADKVGTDPHYWPEGTALLLKIKDVPLRPVTTAWEVAR